MMTFAAGATIGDVGVGGGDAGDGGGDTSGGEGDPASDGASDDADGEGDGEGDLPHSDDATGEEGDDEQLTDPDAPVDLGDGRQVPGKFKKLFDLAKKAGCEKEAKQLYFAQQRLAKAIPGGVNAAIELAKSIEELGGVEGVEQLQSDVETFRADAELFETNQSKWIEQAFKEDTDSALKAFAHSLDYVSEQHPDHYDHYMAKVIVNDLSNLHVREIYSALNASDKPEHKALAKELADYYNSRLDTSKKVPEKKVDAQSKALTDREQKVEEREMGMRFKEVNTEVFPALKTSVTKRLQAEAKTAGVDLQKIAKEYPGEWRDLLNDIHKRVMRAAQKDQRFIDKHYALVKKGDLKRAAKAVNDKHDAIIPDAVREAIAERGLFRGKKKPAGGGEGKDKGNRGAGDKGNQNAAAAGWAKVSKRPENSLIDWSKTSSAMQLDGKYILKDGKKVVVQY
jgi:regulator of sigma D